MANAPRFINPQNNTVGIITPEKRKLYLLPYADLKYSTDPKDVFVVEGEHYRQFVAPGGPLACFPEAAAVPAAVAKSDVPPGLVAGATGAGVVGGAAPVAGSVAAGAAGGAGTVPAAGETAVAGDAGGAAVATAAADAASVSASGEVTPKADEPKDVPATAAKPAPRPVPRPARR